MRIREVEEALRDTCTNIDAGDFKKAYNSCWDLLDRARALRAELLARAIGALRKRRL
jgi:hypothetical protein